MFSTNAIKRLIYVIEELPLKLVIDYKPKYLILSAHLMTITTSIFQ